MKQRSIIFYSAPGGNTPVQDFLDSLTSKQVQKVLWVLSLIRDLARIPTEFFKKLDGTDDLWEVRVHVSGEAIRLLGFWAEGNFIVLTNGFSKKSEKTPGKEIILAKSRKREFEERKRRDG